MVAGKDKAKAAPKPKAGKEEKTQDESVIKIFIERALDKFI